MTKRIEAIDIVLILCIIYLLCRLNKYKDTYKSEPATLKVNIDKLKKCDLYGQCH
jgi:hypothetical protein